MVKFIVVGKFCAVGMEENRTLDSSDNMVAAVVFAENVRRVDEFSARKNHSLPYSVYVYEVNNHGDHDLVWANESEEEQLYIPEEPEGAIDFDHEDEVAYQQELNRRNLPSEY